MSYLHVVTAQQFNDFCDELARAHAIGFDTEFVSEHTYRSQLCLLQVCWINEPVDTRSAEANVRLAIVDPLTAGNLDRFWQLLAEPGRQTVVHAGREELGFSLQAINALPSDLLDVQIAAGLVGNEFPAGYAALASRYLGKTVHKGETRTDWRRRPLSEQQLEYALEDVRHLLPLRDEIVERLKQAGRLAWLSDEMEAFRNEVAAARTRERWRRISGLSGLSPRSLAVAREIWRWREAEAQRRDTPARFVLRDDLLVELAKRRSADTRQMKAIRGMDRPELKRALPMIAEHIQRGLELPADELPKQERREVPNQINVLGQFLSTALSSLCRSMNLATAMVGTASDVRDLIAYRLGFVDDEVPVLARGWRAEVVGSLIDDLLSGKLSIRIVDPLSDHPLAFEPPSKMS